jgi:hypothetical protein
MNRLNLPLPTAREISPEEIENLAAEGLSRREMAERLGMSYERFCYRLANRLSLTEAFKRGKSRARKEAA